MINLLVIRCSESDKNISPHQPNTRKLRVCKPRFQQWTQLYRSVFDDEVNLCHILKFLKAEKSNTIYKFPANVTTIETTTSEMFTTGISYSTSKYLDHERFEEKCCLANKKAIQLGLVSCRCIRFLLMTYVDDLLSLKQAKT